MSVTDDGRCPHGHVVCGEWCRSAPASPQGERAPTDHDLAPVAVESMIRNDALQQALAALWMEAGRSMLGDEVLKRADARIRALMVNVPAPPQVERARALEEYERFTRLAAMWECANPGPGASDTCRDEYPEDADEWCLTCIARSILAASSHQDNEPEVKT